MPAPGLRPAATDRDEAEIESCLVADDADGGEDSAAGLNADMLAALQGENREEEAISADC